MRFCHSKTAPLLWRSFHRGYALFLVRALVVLDTKFFFGIWKFCCRDNWRFGTPLQLPTTDEFLLCVCVSEVCVRAQRIATLPWLEFQGFYSDKRFSLHFEVDTNKLERKNKRLVVRRTAVLLYAHPYPPTAPPGGYDTTDRLRHLLSEHNTPLVARTSCLVNCMLIAFCRLYASRVTPPPP